MGTIAWKLLKLSGPRRESFRKRCSKFAAFEGITRERNVTRAAIRGRCSHSNKTPLHPGVQTERDSSWEIQTAVRLAGLSREIMALQRHYRVTLIVPPRYLRVSLVPGTFSLKLISGHSSVKLRCNFADAVGTVQTVLVKIGSGTPALEYLLQIELFYCGVLQKTVAIFIRPAENDWPFK